jgi:hypothetical protein
MTRLISLVVVAGTAGVAMADGPLLSGPANAGGSFGDRAVLVNQNNNGTGTQISQSFGDFPDFTTLSFDDFTLGSAVNLTSLTVYGTENGTGVNDFVVYAITSDASNSPSTIYASGLGSQVGSNLVFDLTGVSLGAGTYWVTAFVVRDFGTGGQWFWNQTADAISGSESFVHNPGGGFGLGTDPVSASALFGGVRSDLAFTIEGDIVPAPSALALLGLGGLVAGRRRR